MARKKSPAPNARLIFSVLRLFWAKPLLLVGVLVALVLAVFVQQLIPTHVYQGIPRASQASNVNTWFHVLRNHGFVLGYSEIRGNPLWVAYALTPPPLDAQRLARPSHFESDWRILNFVNHESYTRSGYDRGHMAPNHAISTLYGASGQQDSFLISNITPQKPNLNQKIWKRLEEMELSSFTHLSQRVWVITGPIFSGTTERLSSDWRVEIPDAFYKIYVTETQANQPMMALGFIIPQTVTGKEPLANYVQSIDEIERQTGLDFLSEMEDAAEQRLESEVAAKPWGVLTERGIKREKKDDDM